MESFNWALNCLFQFINSVHRFGDILRWLSKTNTVSFQRPPDPPMRSPATSDHQRPPAITSNQLTPASHLFCKSSIRFHYLVLIIRRITVVFNRLQSAKTVSISSIQRLSVDDSLTVYHSLTHTKCFRLHFWLPTTDALSYDWKIVPTKYTNCLSIFGTTQMVRPWSTVGATGNYKHDHLRYLKHPDSSIVFSFLLTIINVGIFI